MANAVTLTQLLAREPQRRWYAVLDAAVLEGLLDQLYPIGRANFACLLRGAQTPDVAHVAPYLVSLSADSPLLPWLQQHVASAWGYLMTSTLAMQPLHRRLRQFSETRANDGRLLYFRFWDPRVLSMMSTLLDADQAQQFMEGVEAIYMMAGEAPVTQFTWVPGERRLVRDTLEFAQQAESDDAAAGKRNSEERVDADI